MSRPGLCESDNIKRMITLTAIILSGAYCITKPQWAVFKNWSKLVFFLIFWKFFLNINLKFNDHIDRVWLKPYINFKWDLVVTSNENHQIIHLFNIVEIFHLFKKLEYHQFQNFSNNIDFRWLSLDVTI